MGPSVSRDAVAFAMELMLSPISRQSTSRGGEGSRWFGIDTSPMSCGTPQRAVEIAVTAVRVPKYQDTVYHMLPCSKGFPAAPGLGI